MEISDFNFNDWIVQWSGSWSILSMSYWGEVYTGKPFVSEIDQCIQHTVMIWRGGKSDAFWRASEKADFGKKFNALVKSSTGYLDELSVETKKAADQFLDYEIRFFGTDINLDQFREFQRILNKVYYPLHIQNKIGVDYLDQKILAKYFFQIEETREYITPVFDRSEKFMIELAKIHAKKTSLDYKLILSSTGQEFEDYLGGNGKLLSKEVLSGRFNALAFLTHNGKDRIVAGSEVDDIEKIVSAKEDTQVLKGATGYPGKVTGTVKVISNPTKSAGFAEGDILVSGMTRPDFLPLMKKASAIITDSGGLLCHAAITARELKRPCVIGTKIATKVLKDGDIVEVNADKGLVTKL